MKPRFLLDTDTLSDYVRYPEGRIAAKLAQTVEGEVATSIVVAAELRFGAVRGKSQRVFDRVRAVLDSINVLPLEPPVDEHYAHIRAWLESKGTPISGNDTLLAAHALSLSTIFVTGNVREFSRVPNLTIENWLRP